MRLINNTVIALSLSLLPTEVLMAVSKTYVGIAEKITGGSLRLSDNPRAEIIDVLRQEFSLVD